MADDAGAAGSVEVKICGVTRRSDAEAAVRAGADYLGTVLAEGSPRRVTPDEAARIGRDLAVRLVVVVVGGEPGRVVAGASEAGAAVVQLHGGEEPGLVARIREGGEWEVWKAVRVRSPEDVRAAGSRYGEVADGLLLDAWHPRRAGGTGRRFPWRETARAVRELARRTKLIVAGGLDPGNVAEAVRRFGPRVVDVSSGVEASPGVKDPERVAAFIRAARGSRRDEQGTGEPGTRRDEREEGAGR